MDFLHKASAKVVEIAQERTIDTIINGKNEGWKMEVDMQKTTKQAFIQICHFHRNDSIQSRTTWNSSH
ncbi:hypothetical protein J7E67_07340 [Bacillus sp. ISL-46]|nr:hypothetical protein [Bacillus sp. ISL-46]MBT2742263.1 hypothetical protein [Bacillus sp. ISL-77]